MGALRGSRTRRRAPVPFLDIRRFLAHSHGIFKIYFSLNAVPKENAGGFTKGTEWLSLDPVPAAIGPIVPDCGVPALSGPNLHFSGEGFRFASCFDPPLALQLRV